MPGGPGRIDLAFDPHEPRDPAGRWVKTPDYRMFHRPFGVVSDDPDSDDYYTSAPGYDIERVMPDYYSHPEWYRTGDNKSDTESGHAIRSMRGNPDAEVTIYRALPSQHDTIHAGDWVTLSKTYAENHLEGPLNGEGHVISRKVKARDIVSPGDSVNEWGYNGTVDLSRTLLSCAETTEFLDLANPTLRQTRYITGQLLDGADPATLLHHRGASREVAQAVAAMASQGTKLIPNARRNGHPLTMAIRVERDREALYRGAYMLKAAERVQASVNAGKSLREAIRAESPYYNAHEKARKNRLESVTETQRIAGVYGSPTTTPQGSVRTLVGWYLNPLLNNDPECIAANGNNFWAEEGTVIGFPGAVHLNCGCVAGPPIEGAGMVNDAVRGVVTLGHVASKPAFPLSRKRTA